jgi:tRNA 2-selenouridine synthase
MILPVDAPKFLEDAGVHPIVDVRSPAEFAQGHIPGAVNIALFDDDERAQVGIIYKNSGPEAAVLKGMELAGPKMAGFVKKLHAVAHGKEILLHCWRGGMRSRNMAWVFSEAGYTVSVLDGGYKAYRRFIRSRLSLPARLMVLGGLTGSGKTGILRALEEQGQQALDLEKLACHKGSVFGSLGQDRQPTNEQFENDIHSVWSGFDLKRPVWVEDESRAIGNVNIPDPLFDQMGNSPMIRIECSRESRIDRLVREYAQFGKVSLGAAVEKIREKLGDRINKVFAALGEGDFATVADISLHYYDKTYEHSVSRRPNKEIYGIGLDPDDPGKAAKIILHHFASMKTYNTI